MSHLEEIPEEELTTPPLRASSARSITQPLGPASLAASSVSTETFGEKQSKLPNPNEKSVEQKMEALRALIASRSAKLQDSEHGLSLASPEYSQMSAHSQPSPHLFLLGAAAIAIFGMGYFASKGFNWLKQKTFCSKTESTTTLPPPPPPLLD